MSIPAVATLRAEIPPRILAEVEALVSSGWFRSIDDLVIDALKRYLDSHRDELMASLMREDVEWGLHGID